MNSYKKILLTCTLFVVHGMAVANSDITYDAVDLRDNYTNPTYNSFEEEFEPFFELLLMGGFATLDQENANVQVAGGEIDTLVQTNNNSWDSWTGQVGIGYIFPLADDDMATGEVNWFPIITPQINAYYLDGLNDDDIEGEIWRFQDPNSNQQAYNMDFSSARVMFDVGLTIMQIEDFSIYGIAGAGIAFSQIDFHNLQHDCDCEIRDLNLDSNNSTGFAYEFGGGITYNMLNDLAVSVQYLYTGLTDIELGNNDVDFDAAGSKFDLNTQAVMLGLRFAL